jgi:hypothetical protein
MVDPNGWAPLLIMSNSAKQREFLKKAVKTIKDLGCEVTIEQNKHYKIKIRRNDLKIGTQPNVMPYQNSKQF